MIVRHWPPDSHTARQHAQTWRPGQRGGRTDGHTLGMNRTEIAVLKQVDKEVLCGLCATATQVSGRPQDRLTCHSYQTCKLPPAWPVALLLSIEMVLVPAHW